MNNRPPRPGKHHPVVELNFFKRLAHTLQQDAPEFVTGMTHDEITLRLSYAGLPGQNRCYDYLQRLANSGWYDFTDNSIQVFLRAHEMHTCAWHTFMKQWVKDYWQGEHYCDGQAVIRGNSHGRIYINAELQEMAAGYFRDADWVRVHGDSGGFFVFWEDLTLPPDSS